MGLIHELSSRWGVKSTRKIKKATDEEVRSGWTAPRF